MVTPPPPVSGHDTPAWRRGSTVSPGGQVMRMIAAVTMAAVLAGSAGAQEPPKPGPEHQLLKKREGAWDTVTKAGGMEIKGVITYKMELGGLWLVGSLE